MGEVARVCLLSCLVAVALGGILATGISAGYNEKARVHAGKGGSLPAGKAGVVERTSGELLVVVGSTNPVKVAPVQAVLARAFPGARVVSVPAASGVPDQPIGAEQIRQGAEQRARAALTHEAVPQAARAAAVDCWGVGLEGGVIFEEGLPWLTGAVAILSSAGRAGLAWSPRIILPPGVAQAVRDGAELGPVLDTLSGVKDSKTKLGAIGYLTNHLVPRGLSWEVALACALAPFLHPQLYHPELQEGTV